MESREKLLNDLISSTKPVSEIIISLNQYSWDSEKELVFFTKTNLLNILERYVKSELSANQIEDWANAIESRDDIGFENDCEEIIFELANPILTQELTVERAEEIIKSL